LRSIKQVSADYAANGRKNWKKTGVEPRFFYSRCLILIEEKLWIDPIRPFINLKKTWFEPGYQMGHTGEKFSD
jgi:hypothetical protein